MAGGRRSRKIAPSRLPRRALQPAKFHRFFVNTPFAVSAVSSGLHVQPLTQIPIGVYPTGRQNMRIQVKRVTIKHEVSLRYLTTGNIVNPVSTPAVLPAIYQWWLVQDRWGEDTAAITVDDLFDTATAGFSAGGYQTWIDVYEKQNRFRILRHGKREFGLSYSQKPALFHSISHIGRLMPTWFNNTGDDNAVDDSLRASGHIYFVFGWQVLGVPAEGDERLVSNFGASLVYYEA